MTRLYKCMCKLYDKFVVTLVPQMYIFEMKKYLMLH